MVGVVIKRNRRGRAGRLRKLSCGQFYVQVISVVRHDADSDCKRGFNDRQTFVQRKLNVFLARLVLHTSTNAYLLLLLESLQRFMMSSDPYSRRQKSEDLINQMMK